MLFPFKDTKFKTQSSSSTLVLYGAKKADVMENYHKFLYAMNTGQSRLSVSYSFIFDRVTNAFSMFVMRHNNAVQPGLMAVIKRNFVISDIVFSDFY